MSVESLKEMKPFVSTSQFFEDFDAFNLAGRITDGFYVEVGGNNPIFDSTTYGLYRVGWSGIVFEPNPKYERAHKVFRENDQFILGAAWSSDTVLTLNIPHVDGWARTTELKESNATYEGFKGLKKIQVDGFRISKILELATPPKVIDFMSIDVEGDSIQVLRGLDFNQHRPRILCIEHSEYTNLKSPQAKDNSIEITGFLKEKEYRAISKDFANLWFVDSRTFDPKRVYSPDRNSKNCRKIGIQDYEEVISTIPGDTEWRDIEETLHEMLKQSKYYTELLLSSKVIKLLNFLKLFKGHRS